LLQKKPRAATALKLGVFIDALVVMGLAAYAGCATNAADFAGESIVAD
jgi:hypothetical protein